MALYLVTLPASAGGASLVDGADGMVVAASNSAAALDVAKSHADSGALAKWEGATATAISGGALTEYSLYCKITPTGLSPVEFETVDGFATLALLAADMVTLLNADTAIISGTDAAKADGPPVVITIHLDNGLGAADIVSNMRRNGVPVEGGWAMTVDAPGAAGEARTLTFPDPASVTIPTVFQPIRSGVRG